MELVEGRNFARDTAQSRHAGGSSAVGCAAVDLPREVLAGDVPLLNDGAIVLKANRVEGTRVETFVQLDGSLGNRKGINRQGGGLSASALTDKDREDIVHGVSRDADLIAVSFPRSAEDLAEARRLVREASGHAQMVAKIERAEASANLKSLIDASDLVIVARGDLDAEIGDAELPGCQKRIISAARERNRLVITATQMSQ